MGHLKKIRETNAGQIKEQMVSQILLDVSSLIFSFFTNTDVVRVKENS